MKALIKHKSGNTICLEEIPKLEPTPNHVIIKVLACPINHFDRFMYKGLFPIAYSAFPDYDCIGFEGAGIIEEIGPGVPLELKGKKCAFFRIASEKEFLGCYSQFARVHYMHLLILKDNSNIEDFCGSFINPLTSILLSEAAKKLGSKSVIITAGYSSIGKMIYTELIKQNIEVISIVRKENQAKQLQDQGNKFVLNSNDVDFVKKLKELIVKLKCEACLDCVGGELSGKVINCLGNNSTVIIFGDLDGEIKGIKPTKIALQNIKIVGFSLATSDVILNNALLSSKLDYISDCIQKGLNFKMKIHEKIPFEKYQEAFEKSEKGLSEGKIILTLNQNNNSN